MRFGAPPVDTLVPLRLRGAAVRRTRIVSISPELPELHSSVPRFLHPCAHAGAAIVITFADNYFHSPTSRAESNRYLARGCAGTPLYTHAFRKPAEVQVAAAASEAPQAHQGIPLHVASFTCRRRSPGIKSNCVAYQCAGLPACAGAEDVGRNRNALDRFSAARLGLVVCNRKAATVDAPVEDARPLRCAGRHSIAERPILAQYPEEIDEGMRRHVVCNLPPQHLRLHSLRAQRVT